VLAALQHELEAAMAGLVHVSEQVPVDSTVVEPLALASKAVMSEAAAAPKEDESTSKKPAFMTHSAYS
jgi:hypothetical protein